MGLRHDFDVLVVGGGPAGSACATLLARAGGRVAIVEASDFSKFRVGETLEASIGPVLARLGLPLNGVVDWGLASDGVGSVWNDSTIRKRPSMLNPYGRGWHVDRLAFDRMLFENAGAAGVTLFKNSRVGGIHHRSGRWHFSIISDQDVLSATTPMVVEATGRTTKSQFASSGSRLWLDRLVGLAIYSDDVSAPHQRGSALVEAAPGGWWYSVFLPGNKSLAVFFTDADLLPRGKANIGAFIRTQLQRSYRTRERCPFLETQVNVQCWKIFDARSSIRRVAISRGCVAAGDALMALDPLSGHGVVAALNSGVQIAEWLASGQSDSRTIPVWVRQASTRFNDYMEQRLRTYDVPQTWTDSAFWRRRRYQSPSKTKG